MTLKKTLTMQRTGTFTVNTYGDHHCGINSNQAIKYDLVVTCDAKPSLDTRGFLFEQREVDNYFQGIKFTELSCELLVINCAQGIVKLIKKENPTCKIRGLKLTLSAAPYAASMTYEIKEEKE